MSNYIDQEVLKILGEEKKSPALKTALASAWIMGNLKGINLKILEVSKISSLADYFVLGSALNTTQVHAMADTIYYQMKKNERKIQSIEGGETADWILLDLDNVLVHVFHDPAREAYNLDGLWQMAPQIEIPQSYYFSPSEEEKLEAINKGKSYY